MIAELICWTTHLHYFYWIFTITIILDHGKLWLTSRERIECSHKLQRCSLGVSLVTLTQIANFLFPILVSRLSVIIGSMSSCNDHAITLGTCLRFAPVCHCRLYIIAVPVNRSASLYLSWNNRNRRCTFPIPQRSWMRSKAVNKQQPQQWISK